jgi:Ca2+-binding EF-hand superfamily protein
MKLTTLKLGVVALGLFAYSQTTTAQDKKPDPEKMFKSFDANEDGSISLEEFKNKKRKNEVPAERLEKNFARMDEDSNGSVTLEEFKTAGEKMKSKGAGEGMKKKKEAEKQR